MNKPDLKSGGDVLEFEAVFLDNRVSQQLVAHLIHLLLGFS